MRAPTPGMAGPTAEPRCSPRTGSWWLPTCRTACCAPIRAGIRRRHRASTEAVSFDLQETDRLLSTTRAVRRRLDLDRPVEREVILDCLRLAVQAPTASNDQSWRWMVVSDPDKRAALADLYRENGLDYLDRARHDEHD